MGISESKKKIVIDNYFKKECDVNTSIKEAFIKGFELGLKKAPQPKTGHWIKIKPYPLQMHDYECSECLHETDDPTENYCSECGAKMVEPREVEG